jgi:hypothetical protein
MLSCNVSGCKPLVAGQGCEVVESQEAEGARVRPVAVPSQARDAHGRGLNSSTFRLNVTELHTVCGILWVDSVCQ